MRLYGLQPSPVSDWMRLLGLQPISLWLAKAMLLCFMLPCSSGLVLVPIHLWSCSLGPPLSQNQPIIGVDWFSCHRLNPSLLSPRKRLIGQMDVWHCYDQSACLVLTLPLLPQKVERPITAVASTGGWRSKSFSAPTQGTTVDLLMEESKDIIIHAINNTGLFQ